MNPSSIPVVTHIPYAGDVFQSDVIAAAPQRKANFFAVTPQPEIPKTVHLRNDNEWMTPRAIDPETYWIHHEERTSDGNDDNDDNDELDMEASSC